MENLSNFKAQMEYENIETRLNREAGKSGKLEDVFSSYANVSLWLRDMQPKTGFVFVCVPSSLWAFEYYSKNLKIECQQRVKL